MPKLPIMKRLLFAFVCLLTLPAYLSAQLLTWTPDFAKPSDNITITMDASKGNRGLFNYANPNDVYVHIGVISSASANSGDWQHAPFTWGTTVAAAKATSLGNNKYSFTIANINNFFTPVTGETLYQIAILFRNGSGSVKQANTDGSDMYVPLYSSNVAIRITNPPFQPKFVPEPEPINKTVNDAFPITAISNKPATLHLYLNGNLVQTAAAATSISANPTLTLAGNNTVIAEAIDGATTIKDSVKFFVTSNVTVAPLPAGTRTGINYLPGNTSAVLVLNAPGKTRVSVIGEFPGSNWTEQTAFQMNTTPDGNYWWLQINGLTPGTEYAYQYLVDGNLKIADPYSEKILDPYNNNDQQIPAATYPNLKAYPTGATTGIVSILQTNAPTYNWVNTTFTRPDKRNLFVYELLVRDFVAAHDWKTLKDTLTYLKRLGVNAIEIMPFNEFEGNESWGYNPDFYFAPDKYYGPKNTLKEFIDACHGNGIAVVMDIALNHSFGLSPMVQLYWDGVNNRPAANNPWFNPTPRHAFNVGFDMNHESAATHAYFSRIVEHWLQEYRLDGFRFDLSKGFTQTQTCDANGANCNVDAWSATDASRIAIWKGYYDTLQLKSPGSYVILEHFAANDEEKQLSNYGMMLWGNMNYNFNEASMGFTSTSNFENGLHSTRGWTNPYLVTYMESHDEERLAYKNINFGNAQGAYNIRDTATSLKRNELNTAFFMSMPGPKMIWQFGELGYDYSINYCTNGTISNDCRLSNKPIRWDYKQDARRQHLYDVYANMAKLRYHGWYKDVFIANNVTIAPSLAGGFKTMTIRSANDTSILCVIGNFDVLPLTVNFSFPTTGTWYDYLNNTTINGTITPQVFTLQPGEFHVYLNRNAGNLVSTPVIDVIPVGDELRAAVYPNPVSASSTLKIGLPKAGKTTIALFNTEGQQMGVIYAGNLGKGEHLIPLTGKMNNLPAGIYFLQLTSSAKKTTVKITIQ